MEYYSQGEFKAFRLFSFPKRQESLQSRACLGDQSDRVFVTFSRGKSKLKNGKQDLNKTINTPTSERI